MRSTTTISVLALASLVGAATPASLGAFIDRTGTGWADFESDFQASLRHVRSDRADFEIGLGADSSRFAATEDASWVRGDNAFAVAFDRTTREVSVSLNGREARWTAPDAVGEIMLQLIARNRGGNGAALSLSGLTLNGAPIDGMARAAGVTTASSMAGTPAPGELTWMTIGAVPGGDWTLTGTVRADWEGPSPTRSHTRVDVGFAIPEPASMGLATVAALGAVVRRRRWREA